MRNLALDAWHILRLGHWPDWVSPGPGFPWTCVLCVKGGHKAPRLVVSMPRAH